MPLFPLFLDLFHNGVSISNYVELIYSLSLISKIIKLGEKYVAECVSFLLRVGSIKSHHPPYPWNDFLWPSYWRGELSGKMKRELCDFYYRYSSRIK